MRKGLALILALLMMFSMVACSFNAEINDRNEEDDSSSESTEKRADEEEETEEEVVIKTQDEDDDKVEEKEPDTDDDKLTAEETEEYVDLIAGYFVEALLTPDFAMILDAIHPDLLQVLEDAGFDIDVLVEDYNAQLEADLEGLDRSKADYEYEVRRLSASEIDEINEEYKECDLTVGDAVVLDIFLVYDGETAEDPWSFTLIEIDGDIWLDPFSL